MIQRDVQTSHQPRQSIVFDNLPDGNLNEHKNEVQNKRQKKASKYAHSRIKSHDVEALQSAYV